MAINQLQLATGNLISGLHVALKRMLKRHTFLTRHIQDIPGGFVDDHLKNQFQKLIQDYQIDKEIGKLFFLHI
jgi:hypothetical protein